MEDFTIDQFAGSMALILGSIGGLLMIIWKSRCKCSMNCCYLFQCSREPPPDQNNTDDEAEDQTNREKTTLRRSPRLNRTSGTEELHNEPSNENETLTPPDP